MNIKDCDTSYFIELDNIDVNYISNLKYQYDGATCPLWSANSSKNRGLDEFFEFSVMAERRNGSTAGSIKSASGDTIGYPMYTCVICDRDIPIAFRNEHNSSGKHKTCLKIAEAVLQRIRSQLLVEDKKEIVQNSSYTYFCESCAVIVKNTDKTLHEASDAHQKAVLYDQCLNDFLNIYLDKDYLDRADVQYLKPSPKDTKNDQPSHSFNDKTNDTKTIIMNNQPLYHYNDKECDTKAIVKKIEIHGLNFDEANETKALTKNKPVCVTIPSNDTNDLSPDDQESKLTLYPVQSRKQRRKLQKKKKLEFKNTPIAEPKKEENTLQLNRTPSIFQQLRAHRYASLPQKPTLLPFDSVINKNAVVPKHEASNTNYFEVNSKPNSVSDSTTHSDNIITVTEDSISSDSISGSNNTLNGDEPIENDVIDEQYHSIDEEETSDKDENGLIDEQYHSICDPNNSVNDKDKSIDIKATSKDDSNSKTDEKQSPIDMNKLAADQNNETSKPNSVVDYIMLVNSNEYVNVKTENKKDTILSASDLEKYLKTVTTFSYEIRSVHKLKFLNKDYIEIQTLDQCTVTVRADNFNGFCLRDGRLQCRVCMVMVDEDPAEHIYNIDHIANVRAPLEDMHCFRKINDTFKHCIHCNDTFCNNDLHKLLESHVSALKDAIERSIPSKPVEPKKVGRTYCEPCNIYIDSHNFNSHTNGKPHKNNLSLFFTKETKKTDNTHIDSTDKYCDQCKVYVAAHNFSEHQLRHLKKDLVENDAKKNETDKILCEPCNLLIRKEMFAAHMYGKNHKASVKVVNESKRAKDNFCATCNIHAETLQTHLSGEYHKYHAKKVNTAKTNNVDEIYWNYQLKVTNDKTACRICNVFITISPRNITEHLSGQAHKTNYKAYLEKNKIKTVDNNFSCSACKIVINSTKEIDHIESISHKNALTQFNTDKTFCDKCKIYMKTANFPDHICDDFHVFEANKTNNVKDNGELKSVSTSKTNYQIKITANETVCRVCKVKVPNREDNITEHIKGRAHKTNYNSLLDKNKIKMVNKRLFCEACKSTVGSAKEIDHIEIETHKCALEKFGADAKHTSAQNTLQPTQYHCDMCEVDVLNSLPAIEAHEHDFGHRIGVLAEKVGLRVNPLHYHYKRLPDTSDMVECKICKVNITTDHSKMHLESPMHNFKFRSTLNENKMQRKSNGYFCQFCLASVGEREELIHMQSIMHLYRVEFGDPPVNSECNIPVKTSGYRCAVCQVDVPNNPKNITIHERGSSHVAKLKNLSFDDEQKVLMKRTANAREVVCSLCKVTVPVTGIKEHVKGARHVKNKVNATEKSTST